MRSLFKIGICLLVTANLTAQEVVIRSFQPVTSEEAPPIIQSIVGAPAVSGATFAFRGPMFMPSDPLGLLQRKQIQEELDLSKDQISVITELQKDIQRQTQEIFAAQAKFGGDAARMMETAQKAVRSNIEKELKEILSPKQLKRLGQIEVQMSLKNRGVNALTEEKLAKALDVDDKQKKEIRERVREMQQDLHKEITRLREVYRKRLINDLLTDDQLQRLETMSGDDYEVQQPNVRRFSR